MKTTDYESKKIIDKYKKLLCDKLIYIPALLNVFKNIKGKTILDLGCGQGLLAKILGKKGAKVFAADNSKKWIEVCKEENAESKNVKCILASGSNLKIFKDEKFDFVVMSMVLLNISNKIIIKKIFKEISRVLKKSGILIFSDNHPVIKMLKKGHSAKKITHLKNFSYFKNGSKYKKKSFLNDYSLIEFINSHYNLEFYSKLLSKNKMMIEEIIEPKPIKLDKKKVLKNYTIPEYIIFKCRKIK